MKLIIEIDVPQPDVFNPEFGYGPAEITLQTLIVTMLETMIQTRTFITSRWEDSK